ncbi:hypothetical protein [Micromonospora wenchangensis]|uniref:hypothetical protein n=1 Tax=Micromonospora wenchangensis TaxID=1185415 RepID=UPI0037FC64C1
MTDNQTTADRCTHGGDCQIHPDAQGLHDYDVAEMRAELEQWRATFGENALRNAQTILADRERLAGIETAVLHMLALAPDEYRQAIVAARAAGSDTDYAKNNGRAEMIRVFATGLASRAGLPVCDWERIKRDVPADGVYRMPAQAVKA